MVLVVVVVGLLVVVVVVAAVLLVLWCVVVVWVGVLVGRRRGGLDTCRGDSVVLSVGTGRHGSAVVRTVVFVNVVAIGSVHSM